MLKQTLAGLRVLLLLTLITGILYPFAVWTVSRAPGLHANAEGSVITVDGQAVGSDLIGIDPVAADPAHDPWFHGRPSAGAPNASAGSNKSAVNPDLTATIQERFDEITAREGVEQGKVPADAVTASGSGIDPHISRAYADLQVARVARENNVPEDRVRALIDEHTDGRDLGFLGEPGVNVLRLNLAVRAERK